MKEKLLLLLTVLLVQCFKTQAQNGEFSHRMGEYKPLEDAIQLNRLVQDFYGQYKIAVPFPVYIEGKEIDEVYLEEGAILALPKDTPEIIYYVKPQAAYLIDANYRDEDFETLQHPTGSPFRYKVEGEQGSRILKIEVNTALSTAEVDYEGTYLMKISYQIWFFEDKKDIEIHYGENSITDFDKFFLNNDLVVFQTVFIEKMDLDIDEGMIDLLSVYYLTGSEEAPVPQTSNIDPVEGMSNYPVKNRIYVFGGNINLNTASFNTAVLRLYPNPVENNLHWTNSSSDLDKHPFEIYDSSARRLRKGTAVNNEPIDVSSLQSGVYFISIQGMRPVKFIKK